LLAACCLLLLSAALLPLLGCRAAGAAFAIQVP
jgi:hypothetical protein